ncbi:Hypothetical protein PBC10988_11040 [Planctomycetales bacterium 10988]|nr:Hypothetical protein PBC10988_11040 [Planctomycetales bacterium 10988]
MRTSFPICQLVLGLALLPACWASAQIETTTEFGITITSDQVVTEIYQSQDFWPAIQSHLISGSFTVADSEARQVAADFFSRVNTTLSEHLFADEEAKVEDFIEFLTCRMRKYALLRQAKCHFEQDSAYYRLIADWDHEARQLHFLPEEERGLKRLALIARLEQQLAEANLNSNAQAEVRQIFSYVSQLENRIASTKIGKVLLEFEREVKTAEEEEREIVRLVVRAADWAMINRTESKSLNLETFLEAWAACSEYERSTTASHASAVRK